MAARIALGGLLAAMAVVLGHLLSVVPNVELTSLTLFLAGRLLGPFWGAICGVVTTLGFSVTNPMGVPDPVLLSTQCVGYGLWGGLGGVAGRLGLSRSRPALAAAAGLQTISFQVLVNTSFMAVYGWGLSETVWMALPYVAVHVTSNMTLFFLLVPVLEGRLASLARRIDVDLEPVGLPAERPLGG